jgi:ribose transport system substrate-binding protein
MKYKMLLVMSLLLVFGMLLGACAPAAVEEAAPAEAEEEAAPAEAEEEAAEEKDYISVAADLWTEAATGGSAELQGTSDVTIGMVMPQMDNDGWLAPYIGALSKVLETGANLITLDARNSAETQLAMIEDLLTRGVDAIVFVPVDSAALSTGVIKANDAGVPVVTMDRSTEGGDVTALVESNNVKIGETGADLMKEMAEELGIEIADLKVLEVVGDLATSAGVERHEGFSTKASEYNFNIVQEVAGYWDSEKANAGVLDAFQAIPEINAIYMASGCAYYSGVESALKSLGNLIVRGEEGHILLISTDGCPAPVQAIRDGYVDADSGQQHLVMGSTAIQAAFDAAQGKAVEAVTRLDPDRITPDDVDSMIHWANVIAVAFD